jgi:uncharacterized membrane protein
LNPGKRAVAAVLHFFEHKETHAFHVHFDGRLYYVCARCSGLYLGVVLGLPLTLTLALAVPLLLHLGDVLTDLVCLGLALPTMIDWSTQRLALRESTNRLRFATAFLGGFALVLYLLAAVTLIHKLFFLFGVLAYVSLFSLVDRRPPSESGSSTERHDQTALKTGN